MDYFYNNRDDECCFRRDKTCILNHFSPLSYLSTRLTLRYHLQTFPTKTTQAGLPEQIPREEEPSEEELPQVLDVAVFSCDGAVLCSDVHDVGIQRTERIDRTVERNTTVTFHCTHCLLLELLLPIGDLHLSSVDGVHDEERECSEANTIVIQVQGHLLNLSETSSEAGNVYTSVGLLIDF